MIEIRHKKTGKILLRVEADTLARADLQGADLRGADLVDDDLGSSNLRDADLRGADLRGADLSGASLHGANLRGANLGKARMRHLRYNRDTRWPWFFRVPYPHRNAHPWWEFWNRSR